MGYNLLYNYQVNIEKTTTNSEFKLIIFFNIKCVLVVLVEIIQEIYKLYHKNYALNIFVICPYKISVPNTKLKQALVLNTMHALEVCI